MILAPTIRSLVTLLSGLTADVQTTVIHTAATGTRDKNGNPTYAAPVNRQAIVEFKQRLVKTATGLDVLAMAKVTFLGPVVVSLEDKITLPNGVTSPLLAIEGTADPLTGRPYAPVVYLGA